MQKERARWLAALLCLMLLAGMVGLAGSQSRAGPEAAVAAQAREEGPYHGNVRSGIFHRPGCRYYNCRNCRAVFNTREEALQAGYRPCKVCRP